MREAGAGPEPREGPGRIRGVLFDIGDTVMHIHPSVGVVYGRLCREKGIPVDPDRLQASFRSVWERFSRLAPRNVNRFAYFPGGEEEWWLRLVQEVLRGVGIPRRPPDWYAGFVEAFRKPEAWRVYPDVLPTLEGLRRRGLRVGAVSNWDSHLPVILSLVGLGDAFDPLVVSAIEDVEKPSPVLFRRALWRGGLGAGETIFVGNRPEEDYRGAEAAGLRPLLLARKDPESLDGMVIIRNLGELFGYLGNPGIP